MLHTPEALMCANELLRGSIAAQGPTKTQVDSRGSHPAARKYLPREDSVRIGDGLVLSILWSKDKSHLLDFEEDGR
jgi:hypothetical protein